MTNRTVLEAPGRPASVISGALFNHSESVQGQRFGFGPLSLDRQRLVQSGLQARSRERDAGTPAKAEATLFTAPRGCITLSVSVAFRLPPLSRVLCGGVGKKTKRSFCFPARRSEVTLSPPACGISHAVCRAARCSLWASGRGTDLCAAASAALKSIS